MWTSRSGANVPKEIAEQIVDRTDGVPLFIEELTKSVVESVAALSGDRPKRWRNP
jgi:predicted ATPase